MTVHKLPRQYLRRVYSTGWYDSGALEWKRSLQRSVGNFWYALDGTTRGGKSIVMAGDPKTSLNRYLLASCQLDAIQSLMVLDEP